MNIIIGNTVSRFTLMLSLVALCFSGTALAHVKIKETSPADKAQLNTAPKELLLKFEHPNALTKLTLTDTKGSPVNFTFVANNNLAEAHTFPLPALSNGHYTANWSATDKNGHGMSGHFTFMVGAMPMDHQHTHKHQQHQHQSK